MANIQIYKGYSIYPNSYELADPPGGFMRRGTINTPGYTNTLDPGPDVNTYPTKQDADDAFIEYAKKYIDCI